MFTKANKGSKDKTFLMIMLMFASGIIALTLFMYSNGVSGNDFWWHIKVGEWIVNNKRVPLNDIFSWYGIENNIPWCAHEWLSELIFYALFSAGKETAILLFSLAANLTFMGIVFVRMRKYIKQNVLISGIFLFMMSIISTVFFFCRPHIFSFFLLYAELYCLYDFSYNHNSKKIYFIPLIALLWSNLHGGSSPMAYVLCLIFIFCGFFDVSYKRLVSQKLDKQSMLRLCGVTVLTVIAIMINPIGINALTYPYMNMGDSLSMTVISEWQSPDAKLAGQLIMYFLPILLMSIGIICEEKKIRLADMLVMLVFLFLFFRSVRFIMLWYIAAGFYATEYMPPVKTKPITKLYEKAFVYVSVTVITIAAVCGTISLFQTCLGDEAVENIMSKQAIEVVRQENPQRLYNDYDLGGELIYNDIKVFFDSRADLFSQCNIFGDAVAFADLKTPDKLNQWHVDVEKIIEKYNFDAIMILKSRALYSYLISHPERFEPVYEDNILGYFKIIDI